MATSQDPTVDTLFKDVENSSDSHKMSEDDKPCNKTSLKQSSSSTALSQTRTSESANFISEPAEEPRLIDMNPPTLPEQPISTYAMLSTISKNPRPIEGVKVSLHEDPRSIEGTPVTLSEEPKSTEDISPALPEEPTLTKDIPPVLSELKSTEKVPSVLSEEPKSTENVPSVLSEEPKSIENVPSVLSEEPKSTDEILTDLPTESKETQEMPVVLPEESKSIDKIPVFLPEESKSTKEISSALSEQSKSTEAINPTISNKMLQRVLDSLETILEKPSLISPSNPKETEDSTEKNMKFNFSKILAKPDDQFDSLGVSSTDLDDLILPDDSEKFKNGMQFVIKRRDSFGHVIAAPSPLFESLIPDFEMNPISQSEIYSTTHSMESFSLDTETTLPKAKSPKIAQVDKYKDDTLLKNEGSGSGGNVVSTLSASKSISSDFEILQKSQPKNYSSIKSFKILSHISETANLTDLSSETSLSSLYSILYEWVNRGMNRAFNNSKQMQEEDFLYYAEKQLVYGLDVLKQMRNRIQTLLIAVDGVMDPVCRWPHGLGSPSFAIRDSLIDAGNKIWRKIGLLEEDTIKDYERLFPKCRNDSKLNAQLYEKVELSASDIISNLFVKMSENILIIRSEIDNFRNKNLDFCSFIQRRM